MPDDAATKGDEHRFRQRRRQRIRDQLDQGATRKQIAREFAATYRVGRLLAFRWAYDLTLLEAAAGYNDAADDAEAPMSPSTLSRYETWPHGTHSIPPRVGVLQTFAQVYHCAPGDLLDGTDYTDQPEQEAAATALATTGDRANTQTSRYPGDTAAPPPDGESSAWEDEADRRDAVKTLGVLLLAGATRVRQLLRDAESSNVGPLTLAEYDDTVWWLTRNAGVQPYSTLVATADQAAAEVAELLKGRQSAQQRARLELLTGQLAWFQGLFAFELGEYGIARTHLRLARHYGEQLDSTRRTATATVLLASIADVETNIALYGGHSDTALGIVRNARRYATEHTAARLAALEARALAGASPGLHRELAALVDRAEAAVPSRPTFEPGAVPPFGPERFQRFAATALVRARHGRAAEYARWAVQGYETLQASNGEHFHYTNLALARLDLATALLQARQPDPEEAAQLGLRALSMPASLQSDPVRRRTVELLTMFANNPTVRDLPAVEELVEAARGYRPPALPPPPPRPVLGSS